jgi:hypothetical protein
MKILLTILAFITSNTVYAFTYDCQVSKKFDSERSYSQAEIEKWKFSIKIIDLSPPQLARCSHSTSTNSITCDTYKVDKVSVDEHINAKKFYHFSSQFDVQLFRDLSFIENNGRGGFAYGKCLVK